MKPWLKITAGAIAVAAVGTVAYRRAADKLKFSIGGYFPNVDGSFTIQIKVFNPSMFAYPVPTASAKFFYNQKYLGFGRSNNWQKIGANGESILTVILQPDLTAFSEVFLTTLLTGSIPTGITYSGTIYLGRYMMPFESSYSIGKVYDTTTIRNGSRVDKYWTDNDIESKYLGRKQEIQPYLIDTQTAVQYFNLQGIEFGNWMNQSERLNFMFATLCTLQDMANVLGISPSKMGLAQRLQLCFGSRGNGGNAAAFYQRTPYALINLTKTNGAGTFAHEFGHAIDEHLYFSEYGKTGMATGDGAGLAIRLNDFKKGSIEYLFELLFSILYYKDNGEPTQFLIDQKGRTEYYKRRREVWARTFEKYIYLKFKELGIKNTWAVVDDGATPPKDLVLKAEPIIFEIIKTAFGNTAGIGAVYKKLPKVVYKCKDGYYSDHKRKGACNYHQGLKSEKEILLADCKTKAAAQNTDGSSKLSVNDIPVSEINLYLEKFQNRKAAYSEESVNNIIAAVKNETFNFAEFDPVLLWQAPDGLLYMLSGHSRLQAFKTLCTSGLENFCSIPAKILKVSAEEAEEIAIRSNTLSTKEKDTERAMYYMKQIALGKSYSAIIEAAKKTEGSNAARIIAYAYLNPMGKTFTALQSLEAGDPTSQTIVKAIGQWVGEARLKFPMLTNAHEDELYNWLVNGGFGKQYKNKNDFLQKVAAIVAQRTTFGVFEQDKPLNVFNTATKSFAEKQFDEQEQELKKTIKEVEDAIKRKSIEYKGRGATEAKIFELLQNDYGYLSRLRNQFINLQQKKSEVISVSKNEISLFGLKGFLR